MAHFVLIPGSCLGGWVWRRVVQRLSAVGHQTTAVTLTGVGDRRHLLRSEIDAETHVQDVLNVLESEDLDDVVLVAHSYSGLVVTAAAARVASRVRSLVYLDAIVPVRGEAWCDHHPAEVAQSRRAAAADSEHYTLPTADAASYGLVGFDRDWVNRHQSPHPMGYYERPWDFDEAAIAKLPRMFVYCKRPAASAIHRSRARAESTPGFKFTTLDTGHLPMVSDPSGTVDALLQALAR